MWSSRHKCERQLIDEAHRLNQAGKMLAPVIDDAHYLPIESLRKIRLLLEDFPKNHNLILIGHPCLRDKLQLSVNADINSRITWSGELKPLAPDDTEASILAQLEVVGMPETTFTNQAMNLIVQSAEGILKCVRNLALGALLEAVRDQTRTVEFKQVNAVLMQPHTITAEDYNRLLLKKLRQIEKHGDPRHYRAYFPKYLMKALQNHCRHHHETIYLKLKHASYTINQIAEQIEHAGRNQHTQTMAAAQHLLCQKPRTQKTNTDQITLAL